MLKHTRITIDLPDDLIRQAKTAAVEAKTTLSEVISNALQTALARPQRIKPPQEFTLITYGKGGVHPGVDLDDTSALLDRTGGIDDPGRR